MTADPDRRAIDAALLDGVAVRFSRRANFGPRGRRVVADSLRQAAGRSVVNGAFFRDASVASRPRARRRRPIPGQFMDTLRAAESPECNQGIYEALLVSYDTFAAEQPFYRLWDSGAVMYYLDPEVSTQRSGCLRLGLSCTPSTIEYTNSKKFVIFYSSLSYSHQSIYSR